MSTCKCHVSIVSFLHDGDRDKIVRKMDVGVSKDIKTLKDFKDIIDSIKKQYADFYKDGATVVLVRPQILKNLVSMEKWMHQNTDSDKRHICTRVYVHDKNDSSFVWPVFLQGLDVKDEKDRESMLKSCKEISVSKMNGSGHDCYAEDSDVYIFRSTDDNNWIRDTVFLCQQEEVYSMNEHTYRLFLDFGSDSKWETD